MCYDPLRFILCFSDLFTLRPTLSLSPYTTGGPSALCNFFFGVGPAPPHPSPPAPAFTFAPRPCPFCSSPCPCLFLLLACTWFFSLPRRASLRSIPLGCALPFATAHGQNISRAFFAARRGGGAPVLFPLSLAWLTSSPAPVALCLIGLCSGDGVSASMLSSTC